MKNRWSHLAIACSFLVVTNACSSAARGGTLPSTRPTSATAPTAPSAPTSSTAPTAPTAPSAPNETGADGGPAPVDPAQPVDPAAPCGWAPPAQRYDHVIWIWMENENESTLTVEKEPFLSGLATACGSATAYQDAGLHPSLPGYILATSGDSQGISDDKGPRSHPLTVDNIFRQVRNTGQTARSYAEDMEGSCQLDAHGSYAVKHVPALYYVGEDDRTACASDVLPFTAFEDALATNTLPAFASITPNLCHDMHDCGAKAGDEWLSSLLPKITSSPTYAEGRTAVFIVWDESRGAGVMPFVAVAPGIKPNTVVTTTLGHGSLLAFTEDALGITNHLGAAATAPSLAEAFGL